ncbi:hypothetical protein L6258_01405, partial [Candidatus Parcubacteria bacterium]|nr:hypothetical protein [Candidatus Parcubacteria bacterium]
MILRQAQDKVPRLFRPHTLWTLVASFGAVLFLLAVPPPGVKAQSHFEIHSVGGCYDRCTDPNPSVCFYLKDGVHYLSAYLKNVDWTGSAAVRWTIKTGGGRSCSVSTSSNLPQLGKSSNIVVSRGVNFFPAYSFGKLCPDSSSSREGGQITAQVFDDLGQALSSSMTTTYTWCCPPNWQCETPPSCYETDSCGHRRLNEERCCPTVCIPDWKCREPLDCYETDSGDCGEADRYNQACCLPPEPEEEDWFQSAGADVYSAYNWPGSFLSSMIPLNPLGLRAGFEDGQACFSLGIPGSGVLIGGSNDISLGKGSPSCTVGQSWVVKEYTLSYPYTYSWFDTNLPYREAVGGGSSVFLGGGSLGGEAVGGGGFWRVNGDLEVNDGDGIGGPLLLLVSGRVTFGSDFLPEAGVVIISQGGVGVEWGVSGIHSFVVTDGRFEIVESCGPCGQEENLELLVAGGVVAFDNSSVREAIFLGRTRLQKVRPAELFQFTP